MLGIFLFNVGLKKFNFVNEIMDVSSVYFDCLIIRWKVDEVFYNG